VIEVPRSPRGPHAVLLDNRWVFLKRTSGGSNESMTYEEVRLGFQDTETKRTKLALVSAELELVEAMAARIIGQIPDEAAPGVLWPWAWRTRYPTALLDSLLGDAYSLLARDATNWALIGYIRDLLWTSNTLSESLSKIPFLDRRPTSAPHAAH
jgi:hypothetical protein